MSELWFWIGSGTFLVTDVLYLAWNRLEYTQLSFEMLKANTDWDLVKRLVVYDDGSEDGTDEYLFEACSDHPCEEVEFRRTHHESPVGVMLDYLSSATCDAFAKIDNDIVVPAGWLPELQRVMEETDYELLGMEAGRMGLPKDETGYTVEDGSHIGGVGLMNRLAFQVNPPMRAKGRYGFTEWQLTYRPRRGWIRPDLLVSSLDRVPLRKWMDLTREYWEKGWLREKLPYPYHSVHTRDYWSWWADEADIVESDWS